MIPLIRSGDVCRFVACEPVSIRAGEIILYSADNGQLIAHRVHRVLGAEGGDGSYSAGLRLRFLCKGDANAGFDRLVEAGHCVGKLLWIRRSGAQATFPAEHAAAVLWGRLLLRAPRISRLLRRALDGKRDRKRRGGFTP